MQGTGERRIPTVYPPPLLHETHTPAFKDGRAWRQEDGDRLKGKVSTWNHSRLEGEESRVT